MISRNFLKSSLVYSIFGALPLASSIILLPFYTNLLSNNDFGLIAIFISFTLLVQVLVNFAFDAMVGIHYYDYKDDTNKFNRYVGTVVSTLILIGIVFTCFMLLAGPIIFKLIFQGKISFFPYGLMAVATGVFNSFFKTYTFLLINQQRPLKFLWMNLFNFILTLIISIGGLYMYPDSIVGPMYGRLLSGVGIFLLALFYFRKEFGLYFDRKLLVGVWAFCLPVTIYSLMSWISNYVDRFIINYFNEPSSVGLYDFGMKCTLLIDFTMAGLASAIYPKIFSIWKENKLNHSTSEVNKYFHSYSAINLLLIAGTILFIPLIVPIVVKNQNYYQSFSFLPLLAVSFITRAMLVMYMAPAYYFKKTKILPQALFYTAIIQFLFSLVMIKYFGIWGAVWAQLIIKPIQLMLVMWMGSKIFSFRFNQVKMIYLPLIYCLFVIGLTFITNDSNYYLVHSISFILVLLLIFFVYRNEVVETISFFKEKYL